MDEKEKQYLNKRLSELYQQRIGVRVQLRKLDREIEKIEKKLVGGIKQ